MKITEFKRDSSQCIHAAAALLFEEFKENWPKAWPTLERAILEVKECIQPERIARMALDENNKLMGWIGGIRSYDGHAWELHPIVVNKNYRKKGVGRALVEALEIEIRKRGGQTIYLGADDENSMTSLSNVNLYEKTWDKILSIQNYKNHPFSFYEKLGFKIVGVIPDANGEGKPDILMAKKIEKKTEEK